MSAIHSHTHAYLWAYTQYTVVLYMILVKCTIDCVPQESDIIYASLQQMCCHNYYGYQFPRCSVLGKYVHIRKCTIMYTLWHTHAHAHTSHSEQWWRYLTSNFSFNSDLGRVTEIGVAWSFWKCITKHYQTYNHTGTMTPTHTHTYH